MADIFDRTPFRFDSGLKLARYGTVEVIVNEEQELGEDISLLLPGPQGHAGPIPERPAGPGAEVNSGG